MTPAVSILLPTRGRPMNLRSAVNSLVDFAAEPDRLELLVYFDDDDVTAPTTITVAEDFAMHVILHGARMGYKRGHEYYNELAAAAHADLLFIWNDDTEMLTPHWDRLLLEAPDFTRRVQFLRRDILETADISLPAVGRKVFETMGHLSLNCHVDLWLGQVSDPSVAADSESADISIFRDDVVFHHHRLNDQTAEDRDGNYDLATYSSRGMREARAKDVKMLLAMKDWQ